MNNGDDGADGSYRRVLPGFSSLGFRIPPDGNTLGRLLETAALLSATYPSAHGETLLFSGEYHRLWQNFEVEDALPVLECSCLPGMLGFTAAPQNGPLIKAWLAAPAEAEDADPLPVCFASPQFLPPPPLPPG